MSTARQQILDWIDRDREDLVSFLQAFVRHKSPNPPGDTREVADFVKKFLDLRGLPYRIIAAHPEMPNIVGSFECGRPGRHLVLNGHIDVFPVADDGAGWSRDPWGGEIVDGKIYGRGVADMKAGTTASIFTYAYLHRLKDQLGGKLTLTAVSDEETFGPYGARYLMEHHPEVHGDALLNGEPSSPFSVRFGEKGPLWLEITVRTPGAHGAYTHASKSATKTAMAIAAQLEQLGAIKPQISDNVRSAIDAGRATMDRAMGPGAGAIVDKVTLNIGTIKGGVKVNMVPSSATFEADIRLPLGVGKEEVMAAVGKIMQAFPDATVTETNCNLPSWVDPDCEIIRIVQKNVEELRGFRPQPIVSLGGTDARLWRYRNIQACVYGPFPHGMGSFDEHVDIEEFLHIVRTHALSACDFLSV
ncbi:MAG TPA: M20/M25/M40 family metallo-hydrolase [Hyphomicrobiaceae bacterium]|nr:M20/M25/M40 family metallo-hydrolase [Hyphomicrobiaceae bacterium]